MLVDSLNADPKADFITPHFSKRLINFDQDSKGVTLNFEDGSSAQAHVLVGADGIGSPTRKALYTQLAERTFGTDSAQAESLKANGDPIWAGVHIYRFLIDSTKVRATRPDHEALKDTILVCVFLNEFVEV